MDAENQSCLCRLIVERPATLSDSDRAAADRLVEMAIVDEDAMADLLDTVTKLTRSAPKIGWFRERWALYKAAKYGIASLSQMELTYFVSSPRHLKALASVIQRAFDRDGGNQHWWQVRLKSAGIFLQRMGLAKSHQDAVRRHGARLKHH